MSEIYEIRIKGHVDPDWADWFGDLAVSYDGDDNTVLAGPIADQPALHGILDRIRDLNLTLISVIQSPPGRDTVETNEEAVK